MPTGFFLADRDGVTTVMRRHLLKPSTQFAGGDGLIMNAGRLERASAQDDKIIGVLQAMETLPSLARPATAFLTTTGGERGLFIPGQGSGQIFRSYLDGVGSDVPLINGTVCAVADANSTTTQVLLTAAGSSTDSAGGTIFAIGQQRTIATDTVGGGQHTYVLNQAFWRAVTTGDAVYVVPFNVGSRIKLSNTAKYAGVSCAAADKSGGYCLVVAVNLDPRAPGGPYVDVKFLA